MKTAIYNGKVITPDRIIENGYVLIENGTITDTGVNFDENVFIGEKIDAKGNYISPGFIDIHVHGGGGGDFMDGTEEAYLSALTTHAKFGTTSMLPTTTSAPDDEMIKSFEIYHNVKNKKYKGANMLGLHLEGPYLSPKQAGAMDPNRIKLPLPENYEKLYNASNGCIKRWTAAPELEGCDSFGAFLKEKGILGSIGHSDAVYSDVIKAYENGFEMLTHFYSAMSTVTRVNGYRYPGIIEAGYLIPGMKVELIADGCHLPKELLQLVYAVKGVENIILVTDSMRAPGMEEGEIIIGSIKEGRIALYEDGVCKLPDRSAFAGSACTADRLVRTMVNLADVPLCHAVQMLTKNPAKLLSENKKGSIALSKDADIIIFNENIDIKMTMVNGEIIHKV